jgi:hypothetical protein
MKKTLSTFLTLKEMKRSGNFADSVKIFYDILLINLHKLQVSCIQKPNKLISTSNDYDYSFDIECYGREVNKKLCVRINKAGNVEFDFSWINYSTGERVNPKGCQRFSSIEEFASNINNLALQLQ